MEMISGCETFLLTFCSLGDKISFVFKPGHVCNEGLVLQYEESNYM